MIVGQTKSKAEKPGLVPIVTRVSIMDIVIIVIIINVPVLVIVETFSRWPERTQQHLNTSTSSVYQLKTLAMHRQHQTMISSLMWHMTLPIWHGKTSSFSAIIIISPCQHYIYILGYYHMYHHDDITSTSSLSWLRTLAWQEPTSSSMSLLDLFKRDLIPLVWSGQEQDIDGKRTTNFKIRVVIT